MVCPDVSLMSLALFATVVYLLFKYMTFNFNYWENKGLVHIKPFPIFTLLKAIMWERINVGIFYKNVYNKYPNSKLIGSFRMRDPEIVVTDPDLIKEVFVKDFTTFPERFNDVASNGTGIMFNLFNVQGDRWRAMRLKFTPAFTSNKLKHMYHLILEKGEEFQKIVEMNMKKNDVLDVRDLFARFTTDVIGSCAFGVQANSMVDPNSVFRNMGKETFKATIGKALKMFIALLFPKVFLFFNMNIINDDVTHFFNSTMKDIVSQRVTSKSKRHDFVDILLELKGKGFIKTDSSSDNKIEFTDEFMAAQAFIFFAAGFETSSTLMACTLYELAKNPDIQDKVIVDIENALNKNGGVLSYDAIKDMQYLDLVLSEGMRKYPALGVIPRICGSNYTFPGTNVTIEKDCHIIIPVYALHNDPRYFPNPDKFIPERFTPEAIQERHPMVYLPFGEGPRNCIGSRFGKMQSKVGLISFLTKFSVEMSEKTERKIIPNPVSFIVMPKNAVWLKVKPRKPM